MKRREWATHVAAWKRSGQTASEYGEPRGLSGKKLYWWSWHLKGKDGDEESLAVKTRRRRDGPMELVPVTLRPRGSSSGILGRGPSATFEKAGSGTLARTLASFATTVALRRALGSMRAISPT